MGDRVNTGITGLDEMLFGGVPEGHVVTVLGPFGTGKTTFGLQFLWQGLKHGEKGLYVSLEESVESIGATAAAFGWDLGPYLKDKKLSVVKLDPADAKGTIARLKTELPGFIKHAGAQRIVVDSISLLTLMVADESERRARLFELSQKIRETGATSLFTAEAKDDNPHASRDGLVEYISDGVIALQFRERENMDVQLTIQVMKMRRSKHVRALRPYTITERGIEVLGKVEVF